MGRTDRDPAQPGAHRPLSPIAGSAPEGPEKGLLGRIFGLGPIPEDGEGHRTNSALGAANEFVEGGQVSRLPKPLKQAALLCILQGSFLPKWINRRILRLLGRKTHWTCPFVRVAQEWAAV